MFNTKPVLLQLELRMPRVKRSNNPTTLYIYIHTVYEKGIEKQWRTISGARVTSTDSSHPHNGRCEVFSKILFAFRCCCCMYHMLYSNSFHGLLWTIANDKLKNRVDGIIYMKTKLVCKYVVIVLV